MTATRQQRTFYRTFSQHGTGSAMVELEPKDVALLVHISYLDIFEKAAEWFDERFFNIAQRDFYKIERKDVDALPELTVDGAIRYLQLSGVTDTENIIYLYMKKATCLCMRQNLRNPAPSLYYFVQFNIFIFLKISRSTYFIQLFSIFFRIISYFLRIPNIF